jgi:amino acid transporter
MNKTQKGAWFTLTVAILLLVFGAIIYAAMFAPGSRTAGTGLVKVWAWLILVILAGGAALVHFKRKPSDVDFDERDNTVRKNAVLVAFVSLLVLLFASSIVPLFIVGDEGSIPTCLLPIINLGVFLIVMLIYSVAVLVQYCWGEEGEKS